MGDIGDKFGRIVVSAPIVDTAEVDDYAANDDDSVVSEATLDRIMHIDTDDEVPMRDEPPVVAPESSADETPFLTVRDALEVSFDPSLPHFTPRRINLTHDRAVVDCWDWKAAPKQKFKKPLCKKLAMKKRFSQKKSRATAQELAG